MIRSPRTFYFLFTLLITSCTPSTVYFQQQPPPRGGGTAVELTALFEGQLIIEDNCFKVVDDAGQSYVILWPYNFSYTKERGEISVLNENRERIVRVGDKIRLGGGEIPKGFQVEFEKNNPEIVQRECLGQYWLVGSLVEKLE